MKAVVQDMKSGALAVNDVPSPALDRAGVLVRTRRSLISIGTERAVIALAKKGPVGKAKDRPDLARKVLQKAQQEGYWGTYQVVKNLISSPIPLGYSCAGEVIDVGAEASEFRVGDRVACAGLNYANHAEVNFVPRNLVVPLPETLGYEPACFVTVGAIAMHGIRLAEIELGETVVVIGLGLVGQIAAQLARCAGATVIATDIDPGRVDLARTMGTHHGVVSGPDLDRTVDALTGGQGADAVIVCAATKSDKPVRHAVELSRLKGRVVAVGDVGTNVPRRTLFEKEVSLLVSRSYGPGRYDRSYELHGLDYPLPYVRWTERRNMSSFAELLGRGDVNVEPLITHRYAIDDAEQAYEFVTGERNESAIAIVLDYPGDGRPASRVELRPRPARSTDTIRLGVIGAGQFAKGVLLPAFARHKSVRFDAFCTASGFTSRHVAERYGARFCASDPTEIINDENIDAVLIATRHDQHGPLTLAALRAGKAVFVEKPLAMTEASLADIEQVLQTADDPRLMVGFNRRFAPLAQQCRGFFEPRTHPLFISYRVNAGRLPPESWVLDPEVGGGRIIGEVCHFVDTICYLTGATPRRITAEQTAASSDVVADRDAVVVTLSMSDGSVGVIHYLTNGDTGVPKEYCEISSAGRTAILDNYRRAAFYQGGKRRKKVLLNQAKGHVEEVASFVRALREGIPMPIDAETLVAVGQTSFLIHRSLERGQQIEYAPPATQPDEET